MKKRIKLGLSGLLLLAFTAQAADGGTPRDAKPNIVFIYADDLGWTDLGVYGTTYYETPNIDRLAKEGLRFTQAYSVGPNCAPSRASLLTGLYPPRHGIYTVGTAARGDSSLRKLVPVENNTVLGREFQTIGETLQQQGYRTALVGKWQLGNKTDKTDAGSRGFDHVISGNPGTSSYFFPFHTKGKPAHQGLEKGEENEYLTDRLTDEAIRFITAEKDRPFFLYLSYFAVHTPTQAKEEVIAQYRKKQGNEYHNNPTYAAMIESLDDGVGSVLAALDSLGLSDNTLVVFYSDNGGMGAVTSQHPLRGSKGMLYEGGIRVPLLVKWPGRVVTGETDYPVLGIDFYPTLLELAGLEPETGRALDGRSFAPVLQGKSGATRDLFWHFPAYLEAFKGDKRQPDPFRTTPVSVIRSGHYKLLEFYEDGRLELYDLSTDISESRNLADQLPNVRAELQAKLKNWREKVHAWEPHEKNPRYEGDH